MKKTYLFVAAAALLFAGCASDEYLPGEAPVQNTNGAILFSSKKAAMTRADYYGKDAAELLNSKFVVEGTKGESATPDYKLVFDSYLVEWGENTAGTTTTNTHDWEYVGKVLPTGWGAHNNTIAEQTIKYWDYSTDQYDFLAYSLGNSTGATVSAINFGNLTAEAYTLAGTAEELGKCYITDLVTVEKANKEYGNVVTLKFRNFDAKIRLAMYETIPGYAVKDVVFYTDATLSTGVGTNKDATLYGAANCITTEGEYAVYVPTPSKTGETSTDKNKSHVALKTATASNSYVQMGTLTDQYVAAEHSLTAKNYLGRTSNTATYAKGNDERHYVQVLPNEPGAVLNLHVDYTLESIDGSGETIKVVGATAQVPATYTQWKPNYAYTYLFKISDKTNGYTSGTEGDHTPTNPDDPNPSGLYPITFDAVVINSVDENIQETITTIDNLATTTYAKGVNPSDNNEYLAGSNIYISVMDAGSAVALDGTNSQLYKITNKTTSADLLLSEDAVYNVLVNGTVTGTTLTLAEKVLTAASGVSYATSIAAADATDGNETTLAAQSLKYTSAEKGYYAFVYTKEAAAKTVYDKVAAADTYDATKTYYVKGSFVYAGAITGFAAGVTYYTYNPTTHVYSKVTGTFDSSVKYYTFNDGDFYHAVANMDNAKFESYKAGENLYVVKTPGKRGQYAIKVLNVQ